MSSSACDRRLKLRLPRNLRYLELAAALVTATISPSLSAPVYCQPGLLNTETGADAYSFRDDRCEGIYRLRLGGSGRIALRSLTSGRSDAALADQADLRVRWTPLPKGVRLRISVVPIDSPILYRMDTEVDGADGVFQWPARIARRLFSGYRNLGVVSHYVVNGQPVQVACALGTLSGAPTGRLRADIFSPDPIRTLELFSRPCRLSIDCDALAAGSLAVSLAGRDRDGTFTVMIDLAASPRSDYYNLRFAGQIVNAPPVATSIVVRAPLSGAPHGSK